MNYRRNYQQDLGADDTAVTAKPPATLSSMLDSPIVPKAAMVMAAYHGLRRNNGSLVWGAIWGLAGHLLPLLVPALAVAQGYARKKECR